MFKIPEEILKDLEEYKSALGDFLKGNLSPARFKGIRVPWGIYNQRSGLSYMVRIRVASGELRPDQLQALATVSKQYGNGILHITTRQDVQIHNVKIEDTVKIMEYLKNYDLSSRGGGGNSVRNITGCPLAGLCDEEKFDTRPYIVALSEYLLKDPNSYILPRKLKIAFSGCGKDCGLATVNDLGFIAKEKDGLRGFSVYAGGGMGGSPSIGKPLEEFVETGEMVYVAEAIKRVFFNRGERKDRHHARLRFLIDKISFDKFKELYGEELDKIKSSEYIVLRKIKYEDMPYKAKVRLRLPLGDITSENAAALSDLAKDNSGIIFRTSQRQNLYIVNVPDSEIKKLNLLYASSAQDIICCAGATTCNLGFCNSRGLTTELAKVLEDLEIKEALLEGIKININGCPNCCGQHPIGTIGLHGLAHKINNIRVAPFYRISVGGIVEEGLTAFGLDAGVVPARNVPILIKDFFEKINKKFQDSRNLHEFMINDGLKVMKELVKNYSYIPPFEENGSFYRDWGKDEVFSLAGLTQGECGAGVIDMIESDLADSGKNLALAKDKGFDTDLIREAVYLSSRALLIVKGVEPHTRPEAVMSFKKEFIDKKIASARFENMPQVFENGIRDKDEFYRYAEDFYSEVKRVYGSMDSNFNFPIESSQAAQAQGTSNRALNLKGVACPLNYVKTKLFLEALSIGEIIDVYLDDGDPVANVPKSLTGDGQEIVSIKKEDNYFIVTVKKLK